jgi:uncharacterized membrane protein
MESLIAGAVAFVGTHFLLSHPLRRPIAGAVGEKGFGGVYVITAFLTFGWMVLAFRAIPPEPLWWSLGDLGWAIASAVMWFAAVLFTGSLFGNPAFPDPTGARTIVAEPRGVFTITRHPMMWGFALWALVHFAVFPSPSVAVLTAAILLLALAGAALQDRKKAAQRPDAWPQWQARTSYLPFAAQIAGRARWSLGDARALIGGTLIWLVATWAHAPLGGTLAAGVWRWVGG